jgi:hypothetical protein
MVRGADKVLRIIREAIHEGLVSLILQYIGPKKMVNDMNGVVLPI